MIRTAVITLFLLLLQGCFSTGTPGASPHSDTTAGVTSTAIRNSSIDLIKDPILCLQGEQATVVKVVDGDTIDATLGNGKKERVRLIGIDTPERGETCFSEATQRVRELLSGETIHLIKDTNDRDRYGRLVRYLCNAQQVFVEAQLVAEGYAVPYRYYPDVQYADYLKKLGDEAAAQHRGCLYSKAMEGSDPAGTGCCHVCRSGKACGDSCIPHDVTCRLPVGCACQG